MPVDNGLFVVTEARHFLAFDLHWETMRKKGSRVTCESRIPGRIGDTYAYFPLESGVIEASVLTDLIGHVAGIVNDAVVTFVGVQEVLPLT
jgi:hypothetical protein